MTIFKAVYGKYDLGLIVFFFFLKKVVSYSVYPPSFWAGMAKGGSSGVCNPSSIPLIDTIILTNNFAHETVCSANITIS